MENKEREAIFTGFSAILATLHQLEIKVDAAVDAIAHTQPDLHAEYQKVLAEKRTHIVNELSTTLEHLRKTLRKNTTQ
jgi:FtsZ-binding cell division protein ZapB